MYSALRHTTRRRLVASSQSYFNSSSRPSSAVCLSAHNSPFAYQRQQDDQDAQRPATVFSYQIQAYHSSAASERAAALMLGFGALAAVSYAGAQGVKAYNEWKASLPDEPLEEEKKTDDSDSTSTAKEEVKQEEPKAQQQSGPRQNVFKEWFGVGVGSKYYEGGFEDSMTRREAALILGVRESSSAARIKEAHRKLLILNHPDTGGSTYMAGKINEAKEMLMKGK